MINLFVDDNTFYEIPEPNIIEKIEKFLSNYNLKTEETLKILKQDMSKLSKLDNMYIYLYIMDHYYKSVYYLESKKMIHQNKDLSTFIKLVSEEEDICIIKEKVEQLRLSVI